MSDTSTDSTSTDSKVSETIVHLAGIIAPGSENVNVLRVIAPSWIEIELVGEDDSPIANESFHVALPDGTAQTGRLDSTGLTRIEIKRSGICKVSFPELDTEAWERL